jgi:hypothetical protein
MNKGHLTEKELIEYQFKLASDEQMAEMARHLEDCSQCRHLNEKLSAKFAALELLRTEPETSEQLVAKVMENLEKAGQKKVRVVKKPVWLAAAAVFVLALTVVVVSQLGKKEPAKTELTTAKDTRGVLRIIAERKDVTGEMKEPAERLTAGDGAFGLTGSAEKFEESKPPFAPASAIELVTLPRRENVQITIYNSADLTLVREKRNLTLKKGWNWLQFMWANTLIDPTSLNIEPTEQKDKIEIEQLVFPPRLRELGRWLIHSEIEGQVPFEITYFTSGLSWRAFYMGTLSEDEKKMNLDGFVRVANNSGEDYENAQTRLIVGTVHILDRIAELARRQWPYGGPFIERDIGGIGGSEDKVRQVLGTDAFAIGGFKDEESSRKEIIKEGLSEYFLYTIEGTETIADKWGRRLLSFEANSIDVNSLYKYDEDRYGTETIRFISFVNDEKHNLGQTPIPNGNVKIYSIADRDGYLSYVGGADIKYIPVNEEIELNLGSASLVKVEPTLMNFVTENYRFGSNGDIIGWDEIRSWKVTITNTKNIPVDVEITRNFNTAYWDMELKNSEGVEYKKYDAAHGRFNLRLEPQSKKIFEYTVRTYHGSREEEKSK